MKFVVALPLGPTIIPELTLVLTTEPVEFVIVKFTSAEYVVLTELFSNTETLNNSSLDSIPVVFVEPTIVAE